ncbi:hypothetical protein M432DRAFT_620660, partial [Thermoascus aurantiacus ATCC 26904]
MLWSFCFPCFIFLLCILSLSEKPSSFTFLSFFLSHNAQVPSFNLTHICNRTSCPSLAGFDPSLWLLRYLHQRYSESQEKK